LLLENKADANLRNEAGLLAFEEALNSGQSVIAEMLARVSKLEDDKTYSVFREEDEDNAEEEEAKKMFEDDEEKNES